MKTEKTYSDFKNIALNDIPLIDVRAPIEFEKGAFINAVNIPIMDDEQRKLVGICYKEKGNEEAVKLGNKLVSGKIKQKCLDDWKAQIEKHPETLLYCFRGGSRSQISQQWIFEETGQLVPRLEGGYKVFRNYLIDALEPENLLSKPIRLGGCTGSGKTILLNKIENSIDLEGIANHRGSSFGMQITKQPSQISFENNLAYAIIKQNEKGFSNVVFEDEGRNVGSNFMPKSLAAHISQSDLVILEASMQERVDITRFEYVNESQEDYKNLYGETGYDMWAEYILQSLDRIKKRFGGDRHKDVSRSFKNAYENQIKTGSYEMHNDWIMVLLKDYYDPMYLHQIKKSEDKVTFRGNKEEVVSYLKSLK